MTYENLIIIAIILSWIICGIISYKLDFAYYQNGWPSLAKEDYERDKNNCMFYALFGPMNLILILLMGTYKCGFKLK